MTTLQHAFFMQEAIVVLVFWGILFPYLGLDGGGRGKGNYFKYMMVYKHTVPFLAMFHDFLCSHGDFSKKGTYLCIIIYVVYYMYNQVLELAFNIIVYPTPLTSGSCKHPRPSRSLFFSPQISKFNFFQHGSVMQPSLSHSQFSTEQESDLKSGNRLE